MVDDMFTRLSKLKAFTQNKILLSIFSGVAFTGVLGVSLYVYYGMYNISALTGHTAPVYKFLEFARMQSIETRIPEKAPSLDQFDWRGAGVQIYEKHCLQCHGAPGLAPEPFALGMMPPPSAIARIASERSPEQLYWVIKNGVMMSGMPAWKYRLKEQELWELVAFLKKLPEFTTKDYALLRQQVPDAHESDHDSKEVITLAEPQHQKSFKGQEVLQQYNCTSCHVIEGVASAIFHVGPPLTNISKRSFIAGFLPYSRENLENWIMNPTQLKPNTTMPDLGVSPEHAAAMVDYFESISN